MERLYIDTEFSDFFSYERSKSGEVLELSAYAVDGDGGYHSFSEKCRPLTKRWSDGAEKVHQIRQDFALLQQDPEVMIGKFVVWLESLGDRFWEVVTHNGLSDNNYLMRMLIDYNMLSRFQSLCRPVWLDTYAIAKEKKDYIGSKNLKLNTLVEFFGWKINAHNSLEDCKGCYFVHTQLDLIELPNDKRVNLSNMESISKKERIKRFMSIKYLAYGKEGGIYISEHAAANKMAMETILTELWDKYCS